MRKLLHDWLGWGYPKDRDGGDGFQPAFTCRFCNGRVAADSLGNYFHLRTR